MTADGARRRRARMRCWRRGMREMDLILGPYSDAVVATMDAPTLAALEALLEENDQDLFAWITGGGTGPEAHRALLAGIRQFHGIR